MKIIFSLVATSELSAFFRAPGVMYFAPNHCFWSYICFSPTKNHFITLFLCSVIDVRIENSIE